MPSVHVKKYILVFWCERGFILRANTSTYTQTYTYTYSEYFSCLLITDARLPRLIFLLIYLNHFEHRFLLVHVGFPFHVEPLACFAKELDNTIQMSVHDLNSI